MAMPKKGSRSIIVDDVPYQFKISNRDTNLQAIVEVATDGAITTLIVNTSLNAPDDYWLYIGDTEKQKKILSDLFVSVTPAVVEAYIRQALARGWKPDEKGKPFVLVADANMVTGKT